MTRDCGLLFCATSYVKPGKVSNSTCMHKSWSLCSGHVNSIYKNVNNLLHFEGTDRYKFDTSSRHCISKL